MKWVSRGFAMAALVAAVPVGGMNTHVRAAEDAGDAATEEAVPVTVRNDVIGELGVYRTKRDDTLHEVARRFNLGFVELVAANPGVSAWLPGEGTEVVLPTAHILPAVPHEGIVINLPELRLYYFSEDGSVVTHPVGVGREGWETPLGITKVVRKKAAPAWYPPESIRAEKPELPKVVPAGPDNPLGEYALYFGWPRYLLHGTNKPYGVGRRVSSGCIRLYPEDIEKFFPMVPIGTKVMVINEPLKLGWANGMLYMEVHPTLEQANQIELEGEMEPVAMFGVADAVRRAAGDDMIARIDWEAVADAVAQRHGYPVPVLKKTDGRQTASKS